MVKEIITNIEVKLAKFIVKHEQLKEENLALTQDNDAFKATLESKNNQILALQDKVKLMNISKSVDSSKDEVKATRLKINEYVREIDKCIALLNK